MCAQRVKFFPPIHRVTTSYPVSFLIAPDNIHNVIAQVLKAQTFVQGNGGSIGLVNFQLNLVTLFFRESNGSNGQFAPYALPLVFGVDAKMVQMNAPAIKGHPGCADQGAVFEGAHQHFSAHGNALLNDLLVVATLRAAKAGFGPKGRNMWIIFRKIIPNPYFSFF